MRRALIAGATALAAALVAILAWQTGLLGAPDRAALDARFAVRGHRPPDRSVVIVAIDADALERLPRPPFPRTVYADLLDRLRRAGARAIAVDIAFNRPTSDDAALRSAVARARPVVLGTPNVATSGLTTVLGGPQVQRRIGARIGITLFRPDHDGALRRLEASVNGVSTFAVAIAAVRGAHPAAERFGAGGALIDYAGPAGSYPAVSLADVLTGEVPARTFAGRTVLVGATAPAFQDLHPTPYDTLSGVEIHANALATVLHDFPLRRAGTPLGVVLVVLLALLAPLASLRLPAGRAVLAGLAGVMLFGVATQLAFDRGHVLEVGGPVLAGLLGSGGTLAAGYGTADRERRRLREQFAAYDETLVAGVLADGADRTLAPTEIVAGYRLDSVAGRGGMAVVYRAEQLQLSRLVALKLIAPEAAHDATFRARFLSESRAAAAVEHPHVIPVYEAGEDDGLLFIAMRLVDGLDLDTVIRRLGPLAAVDAVRVGTQVGAALDAAHAAGLVHRDVKPANVLVDDDLKHAYLTDFGVARAAGASAGLTRAGAFIGTPDYAAPEQIEGGEIDGRTDLYALGALLFCALTGRAPYVRDSPLAVLRAHVDDPVATASDVDPGLAPFDGVLARALAKEPADRFASGAELARALEAALAAAG